MPRTLAAAAAALLLVSCGSSIILPVASPSPSPIGADSPAADLRTHIDLLFGEHTYVLAKLAVAAVAGRKDEFHAYSGALAANGADITTLMRSALGETAGSQFGQTWTVGNNYFVDYLVAAATHDNAKQAAAGSGLTSTYLPQLTALLTATLSLTADEAALVGADQVSSIKQVVDDAVTSGFAALYADLHAAYVEAVRGGDLVSEAIVSRFVDRFPGSARSKSADFRAVLDTLLLSQAYLLTMASDAAVTGPAAQLSAVDGALAQSATSLGAVFNGVFGDASGGAFANAWGRESMLVVAYAKGADPGIRQSVIDAAAPPGGTGQVYGPDMTVPLLAVLQAVDDQRARAFDRLGDDDRSAAGQLAAVGDSVTDVALRDAPAKFL